MQSFQYEVAISFLASDEAIATELYSNLNERLKTFVYSEKQKEILGTDGIETFTTVFKQKARLIVLLFREGWGKTNWTRIEETAIKDRVLTDGWMHILLIRLDKTPFPIWIPQNYLYVDFKVHGIEGTKAIIEHRIHELGGKIREESLNDYVDRTKKIIENQHFIENYLESIEAVRDAKKSVTELFAMLQLKWKSASEILGVSHSQISSTAGKYIQIQSHGLYLKVAWAQPVVNSISDSKLKVHLFANAEEWEETQFQSLHQEQYQFRMDEVRNIGWSDENEKLLSSDSLSDLILKIFIRLLRDRLNS